MKIVQPIGTIAGTAISRIAITLAEEFARQGHESTLVVWNRAKLDREIDPRVKIIETRIVGVSRRNLWTKFLRGVFKPLLGAQLFLVFFAPLISRQLQKKVLDKGDYDVAILHAHSVFGLRYIKMPYLVVAHSTKSKQLLKARFTWQNELLRHIYIRVYNGKRIGTVSDGIREDFIKHFAQNPKNLSTLNNPFDLDVIRARAEEAPEGGLPCEKYIVSLGRNDPQKRFDRLIRAYAKANIDEHLVILGRANENAELLKQVAAFDLKERVHFVGFKTNPFPFIKAAKILVVSSDYEGLPSTLIESLICGTPVVSTDCPSGPREILRGELSQWLAPVDDEARLARLIEEGVRSPYEVSNELVDRYDQAEIAKKYLAVLQEVFAGCRNDIG